MEVYSFLLAYNRFYRLRDETNLEEVYKLKRKVCTAGV